MNRDSELWLARLEGDYPRLFELHAPATGQAAAIRRAIAGLDAGPARTALESLARDLKAMGAKLGWTDGGVLLIQEVDEAKATTELWERVEGTWKSHREAIEATIGAAVPGRRVLPSASA
jgi:hypothetical protein